MFRQKANCIMEFKSQSIILGFDEGHYELKSDHGHGSQRKFLAWFFVSTAF